MIAQRQKSWQESSLAVLAETRADAVADMLQGYIKGAMDFQGLDIHQLDKAAIEQTINDILDSLL